MNERVEPGQRLCHERVLLIGGAGFIGHHLALALRRLGVPVMVVDNLMINSLIDNVFGAEADALRRELYLGFLLERHRLMREAGVALRNADARQMVDLARAFEDFAPTKVVHLAAIASAIEARRDPGLCFDLQLVTLRNALELCRRRGAAVNQVLLMSSSTVYGDFQGESVDEATRPRPRGIYANTKYMAERLVRTYNHQHGLGTTIVRPSALYGERCVSRRVSQVFIENALAGLPLPLEGGGAGRLDFTDIQDLTDGLVRALAFHGGAGSSETFNLTFGHARTVAELAGIVADIVPGTRFEERPAAPDKPVRGTLSTRRAEDVLGFKARHAIEDGYRRYCQWYRVAWRAAGARVEGR